MLDDLVAKCGPAEACRDAFDRMAKATIAMAMKETGFGQDALKHLPEKVQGHAPSVSANMMAQPYNHDEGNMLDPNLRQHQQQRQKRPAPRFDMDLKDLFSDDEYQNRPSKFRRAQFQPARPTQVKREPSGSYHSAGSAAPQMNIQQHNPYRRQQQPSPQQQLFSPATPIDPSLQISANHSSNSSPNQSQHPQPQNTYFSNTMQSYPGATASSSQQDRGGFGYRNNNSNMFDSLDFLDNFPSSNAGANGSNMTGGQIGADGGAGGFPDYDLGFGVGGLAFDGGAGPSWDENGGFDLFDGFFFGSGAGHTGG